MYGMVSWIRNFGDAAFVKSQWIRASVFWAQSTPKSNIVKPLFKFTGAAPLILTESFGKPYSNVTFSGSRSDF